eukprot:Nitzschia sp. Nitz4//scaffold95_size97785//44405//45694//NITZ4_004666-RA/size97785-processed-gene-0.16-mRNA-1//1//CDS//3329560469//2340//frame0
MISAMKKRLQGTNNNKTIPKVTSNASIASSAASATKDNSSEPEYSTSSDVSIASSQQQRKPSYFTRITHSKRVPVSVITFAMVSKVIDSWEVGIKKIPNWENELGIKFVRKILELSPDAAEIFGLEPNTPFDDPKIDTDPTFARKTLSFIRALDMAVGFLDPDLTPLQEQLLAVGKRHVALGCHPYHWPVVGNVLLQVMEEYLGDKWDPEVQEAWTVIYNFMSYYMVKGLLSQDPSLKDKKKKIGEQSTPQVSWDCLTEVKLDEISYKTVTLVVESWETGIKPIPNWNTKLGALWVRYIFKYLGAEGKKMMGYGESVAWNDPALEKDRWFVMKGDRLISAIDLCVSFLGPDLSTLEATMNDLGKRHFHMDCKPHHWPLVGEALFEIFREFMGENGSKFTPQVEQAWLLIYRFLGYHMIHGLEKEALAHT